MRILVAIIIIIMQWDWVVCDEVIVLGGAFANGKIS